MNRYIAVKGNVEKPVKFVHWWPGREIPVFRFEPSLNPVMEFIFGKAQERGSRYATIAYVDTTPTGGMFEKAICCPKDAPSRKMGRDIAVGRLRKLVARHGWTIQAIPSNLDNPAAIGYNEDVGHQEADMSILLLGGVAQ